MVISRILSKTPVIPVVMSRNLSKNSNYPCGNFSKSAKNPSYPCGNVSKSVKNPPNLAQNLKNLKNSLPGAAQRIFSYTWIVSKIPLTGQTSQDQGVPVTRLFAFNFDPLVGRKLWVFLEPSHLKKKSFVKDVYLTFIKLWRDKYSFFCLHKKF